MKSWFLVLSHVGKTLFRFDIRFVKKIAVEVLINSCRCRNVPVIQIHGIQVRFQIANRDFGLLCFVDKDLQKNNGVQLDKCEY